MAETRLEKQSLGSSPFPGLGHAGKRKTSNFFPLGSGADLESSLGGSLILSSNGGFESYSYNKRMSTSMINGGSSKFFGTGDPIGMNTPDVLATPVRSRNTAGLGMDLIDIGLELSNSMVNFSFSPTYANSTNQNIISISSPSVTSSPFLHSSIWNDSKTQTPKYKKLDDEREDFLFSPFLSGNGPSQNNGTNFNSPPSNAYVSRVNNADFLPSFAPESTPTKSIDNKLMGMREIINKNQGDSSKIKCNVVEEDFTDRIKKLDEKGHELMKHDGPKQGIKAGSGRKEAIVVKLPNRISIAANSNSFIGNILNDNNKKYQEDYCSTFYKRNTQGYMFVKEPTNSLKVNTVGSKSWVQIKIRFPDTAGSNDQVTKKLKVDVKELPVWKPVNGSLSSSSSSKKYVRRPNHINRDTRKYKNNNISKRFGNKAE